MSRQNLLKDGSILQGRFQVVKKIGQGGMGAVYEARHLEISKTVVLKQTFFDEEDPKLLDAFKREAKLLANLRHEFLPEVTDFFSDSGCYYFVMEYIYGEDLQVRLRKEGRFSLNEVIKIADNLLNVLAYLHEQASPVYHRDIKPANIKLMPNGKVKLLDFGIAKGATTESSYLKSSVGYGTPGYAPPEIEDPEEGDETNQKSDIYSLSATLFCLLTGTAPPRATKRRLDVLKGREDPLGTLVDIIPNITTQISELIHKGLSLDPSLRPESAREMRKSLLRFSPFDIELEGEESTDHHEFGDIHFTRKEYKKAILSYTKAIHANSHDGIAYEKRGDSYFYLRDYDRAIADYSDAIKRLPNNSRIYLKCGDALYLKKDYAQAIEKFRLASNYNPRLRDAYCGLGDAYSEIGEYNQAIRNYSAALSLGSSDAGTFNSRGVAHYQNGDYESALKDYSSAIKVDDQVSAYYINRADVLCELGNYRKAISDYSFAIELGEDDVNVFRCRANVNAVLGDFSSAIRDYTEVISRNYRDGYAYYTRGIVFTEIEDYRRALSDLSAAINLSPDLPEAYFKRGDIFYDDGALWKAISDYRKAVKMMPEYATVYWEKSLRHLADKEYRAWLSQLLKFLIVKLA